MPLASRATVSRVARTEQQADETTTQPRRPAEAATKPAPSREQISTTTEQESQADTAAAQESTQGAEVPSGAPGRADSDPPVRTRKPRSDAGTKRKATVKAAPSLPADATPGSMKTRMRELEALAKVMRKSQAEEQAALSQKHSQEISVLMREHQELAARLSKAVFK